jgi:hypothetical protein
MEAICFSETSVSSQQTTRRHIPEEHTLHNHHCENLKSYILHFLYSVCYGNEVASSSDSEVERYVIIRNLSHSIFDILSVFICRREIQTYLHSNVFSCKVAYKWYDVPWRIEQMDVTNEMSVGSSDP